MALFHQADAQSRPLKRFQVLRAAGLEEMQASASSLLTPCRVTPLWGGPRAGRCSATSPRSGLGQSASSTRATSAPSWSVQLTRQVSYYDINFALEGGNRIETRDEQVELSSRRAGVISPQMAPSDAPERRVRAAACPDRAPRAGAAPRADAGRPVTGPIRFRMEMDLTAPAVASWARTVQLLLNDLDEPSGLTAAGAAGSPWSDFLMTGLLLAQPHSYSEWLARGRAGASRPPSVKRVIDLMEREPAGDLSLGQARRCLRDGSAGAAAELPAARGRLAAGVRAVGPARAGAR